MSWISELLFTKTTTHHVKGKLVSQHIREREWVGLGRRLFGEGFRRKSDTVLTARILRDTRHRPGR